MAKSRKSRHAPKKTFIHRYMWWILAGVAVIFGTVILLIRSNNPNITHVKTVVSTPTTQSFQDTNNAVLLSSNDIPDINNNRTLSDISPITISYDWTDGPYAPAMAMGTTNTDLHKLIKISPIVHGTFDIESPNTITFTPNTSWPANTKFTVRMSKKLFGPDVRPDGYSVSFTTPPITATMDSFNLYHTPQSPKSVVGVAIVSFNYPIETEHFMDKVSMKLDGKKIGFHVKFDRFNRTAFIISDTIAVTDEPQNIRIKLNRISALNGNSSTAKITANTTIESRDNMFRITNVESVAAQDTEQNIKQLILVQTSTPISPNTNMGKYITAYLLPQFKDSDETEHHHIWQNDEITPDVLSKSKQIKLIRTDFATPFGVNQYAFAYNIPDVGPRYIYLDIKPGAKSIGDFDMQHGINTVLPVAYPEQTVQIAGTGAVLSLGGDKKLGIMTRGSVRNAYINIFKIKSNEINHLISQTYNVFASDIEFKSWAFGTYDMSVVFQKRIPLNTQSAIETNYASLDLGDYMDRVANDKTGIFIIQAGASENATDFSDRRLVMVTDLGLIRKVNQNGTSTIFVSSLSNGAPSTDIEIDVLGRNGNAIWSGRTNQDGHCEIPAFPWSEYKNAREPVAIVARNNMDVSFIPYNAAYSQRVEYSKFDIDGTYSYSQTPLNAFIFTDRGIYRPGETATIGAIIKNNSFKPLAGVPVRMEITDSRGRIILEKNMSLTSDGMFDVNAPISTTAPIGEYTIRLYSLNVRAKPQDMLGYATFSVAEFVPDTMKITANISGATDNGWLGINSVNATVNLRNLFGTPSKNHRIRAHATLRPIDFSFTDFQQYIFNINNMHPDTLSGTSPIRTQTYTQTIDDVYTNDNGVADLAIQFKDKIPNGTYLVTLNINGFELNSGKSVQTTLTTRVSDAKYLVGYHANTNLEYINRNDNQSINLIALDHTATPITASDLTMRLVRRETLTSLVKDYNNYYKYQNTTRDNVVSEKNITIPENGLNLPIATDVPGTYFVQIIDAGGKILSNIKYFVADSTNTSMSTTTNAELEIKLNSNKYAPGDKILVNIVAPYSGHGLITIERDQVYGYKWFTMSGTASTQEIVLPSDFEGTGYINVSFVRDINSRDIFTAPYTYAVAPFSTDVSNRTIDVKLSAPEIIRDNKLTIEYETNKSGRIMIFAIDEGILQVAKYKTPNPLKYFFKKSALAVETFQILSLLLPEYKILREFAKTGGGDYAGPESELSAALVNPFARRTSAPVAFYSGILDTSANIPANVTFNIPETFNGALRIFAVTTNDNSMGGAETTTTVQSPLVISTSAPTFVAPNDMFNVNTVITNMTNIGESANIQVDAVVSNNLILESDASIQEPVATDAQHLFTFRAQATDNLGGGDITINAMALNDNGMALINRAMTSGISVRPVTPFIYKTTAGVLSDTDTKISDFYVDLYADKSQKNLYISTTPFIYARPLFNYLANYDYPCTEQLVSGAIPYATAPDNSIMGTNYDISVKKVADTINTLKNRQTQDGAFALWPNTKTSANTPVSPDTVYLTAYVVNFLNMAQSNGFMVPDNMLGRALDFLRDFASNTITDDEHARALAYAIYTITSNGYVTTAYIDKFQEYADKNMRDWQTTISGPYIAASYKMMKQIDRANKLSNMYQMSKSKKFKYSTMFTNNVADDAAYLYISNKYFDMPIENIGTAIHEYINSGNYDAYTAARVFMALAGTRSGMTTPSNITIQSGDTTLPHNITDGILTLSIPTDVKKLKIKCPSCHDMAMYYAISQQGFARHVSDASNGIEITREYFDESGNRVTTAMLGDIVNVKITVRARNTNYMPNVAIVDLLPGGFVAEYISGTDLEFSEIREDRVVIYTNLTRQESVFTYRAQVTSGGTFAIAPIHAMSMYNPSISATDTPSANIFQVFNAPNE